MFENIAAIDIGTSSIKVVTVKTGFKDFQIKSFTFEDIDCNIDNYHDAVNEAFNRVLEHENLTAYKIVTCLPMEKTIIRNVTFPFNDVEKIAEAIPFEAEENIPFNLDDLVLDFQTLKYENRNEGRILLAAAHKESMYDYLKQLAEHKLKPVKICMESNSLFECYRYLNKIEEETVIQLHIGNNKTIINIIKDNNLLYTRAISIGIDLIHENISKILNKSIPDAVEIYDRLHLDLTSLGNNFQRDLFRDAGITKQKFKKIYQSSVEIIDQLIEQMILSIKSFSLDKPEFNFNRLLISGGGANISGIGIQISKSLEIPVVSLPFLDEYKEERICTQFPIAFGTVLTYINKKKHSINFLKGEFIPDIERSTKKIYYLSGLFLVLSVIIFVLNVIISTILTSKSNKQYNEIIKKKYKQYFSASKVSDNPVGDAIKLIKKQKVEVANMENLILSKHSVLDMMNEILSNFSANNFDLKNIVINERIIKIDGISESSNEIEEFKKKLIDLKKFDTVSLNIRQSRKKAISFNMTIKLKIDKKSKKKGKLK